MNLLDESAMPAAWAMGVGLSGPERLAAAAGSALLVRDNSAPAALTPNPCGPCCCLGFPFSLDGAMPGPSPGLNCCHAEVSPLTVA